MLQQLLCKFIHYFSAYYTHKITQNMVFTFVNYKFLYTFEKGRNFEHQNQTDLQKQSSIITLKT